jgi:hypothetical protein
MSSFTIKSKVIANRDAVPTVLTDPILSKGESRDVIGVEQVPQTADIGSKIKLVSVPSSARIVSMEYAAANVGLGTSAIDIAAWFPTAVPNQSNQLLQSSVVAGALISSSAFKANIAGVDTGIEWTEAQVITTNTLPKRSQPLWQALGLQADPMVDIDLGFTVRTTNSLSAYVGLRARYVR